MREILCGTPIFTDKKDPVSFAGMHFFVGKAYKYFPGHLKLKLKLIIRNELFTILGTLIKGKVHYHR
jgi:hypothetical protein